MGRESSYLKFTLHCTFIQAFNILYDFNELISVKLHSTFRETVKHERVIGVRAMSDLNPHGEHWIIAIRARVMNVQLDRRQPYGRHDPQMLDATSIVWLTYGDSRKSENSQVHR